MTEHTTPGGVKFTLDGLLKVNKDGKLGGPYSQLYAVKLTIEAMNLTFSNVVQVRFVDPRIHNIHEHGEGLTGYSTIVIVRNTTEGAHAGIMIIDKGPYVNFVAMIDDFREAKSTFQVSDNYAPHDRRFTKLSDEDLFFILEKVLSTEEFLTPIYEEV